MRKFGKAKKSLLLFDLNGVLGYMTNDLKKSKSLGIYQTEEFKITPDFQDNNVALIKRPNLPRITQDLMIGKRNIYDVGIWSSCDQADTQLLI